MPLLFFRFGIGLTLLCLLTLPFAMAAPVEDLSSDLLPFLEEGQLPALAVVVIGDGAIQAAGVAGVRKVGDPARARLEDTFHLGSCTKAMTATLACLLVQEGKLRWETTLADSFPELEEQMHPAYPDVTLQACLDHRAGLPAMTNGCAPLTAEDLATVAALPSLREQRERVCQLVLSTSPEVEPGTKVHYSNGGYIVGAAVLERATGQDWETLMRRYLFDPLGMASAGFGPMGQPGAVHAPWQHVWRDGAWLPLSPEPAHDNPVFMGPAGRVHCSVLDWSRYILFLLRACRGEDGVLRAESLAPLWRDSDYALGWMIQERAWGGGRVFSHAGTNNQNFALVWMAPRKQFAVLVATNAMGPGIEALCDRVCAAMIQRFIQNGE
ncbi:MAG: serine hydrolase domain-containing protein [bacterium]|jgi:CubicO group peptidase (beta-lactamase class C family)|nr:serine hydrolase domain-containing protein [bacterium]